MADEFFDPMFPEVKRVLNVVSWTEQVSTTASDTVWVSNRVDPVVVTTMRRLPSGTLELATLSAEDATWLRGLLSHGRVIGMRPDPSSGLGSPTYLAVGRVTERRVVRRVSASERLWTLEVQVVLSPGVRQ